MNKQIITIRTGYSIVERNAVFSRDELASYLHSKRIRHTTRLEQTPYGISVVQHAFCCPYCGKEVFAYSGDSPLLSTLQEAEKWCDPQLNLFSEETKAPLILRAPLEDKALHYCPRCGNESKRNGGVIDLLLEIREQSIHLSRPIKDLDDLLEIPWIKKVDLNGGESLSEHITFDLDGGNVLLSLNDEQGNKLVSRLVAQRISEKELGFFGPVLKSNKTVKKALKKAFQSFWTVPIPFTLNELDFAHFLLLTMFGDFPRNFYNAVPWDRETGWIMEDFHFSARDLRTPEEAMELLGKEGLPRSKSVKKIFAQKPGLFFYIAECKKLWALLGDVNLFCVLLRTEHIFFILANIHQYPGSLDYYEDFKEVHGSRALLKALRKDFVANQHHSMGYAALSPLARKKVKMAMREQRDYIGVTYVKPMTILFSYPLGTPPKDGKEIAVDGYRFLWLKNTLECYRAGINLENCLVEWNSTKNPVAVVLCGREYVGAIELAQDQVIHFLGKCNDPIEENTPLYKAFEKWTKHFSFKVPDMDYDDLPF